MKRYYFEDVLFCEMCGESTKKHKILGQRLNQSQSFRPKQKEGISVTVKRCTCCGLIYASPLPIPFDLQDHYGTPPEDYWKPDYFTISPTYFQRQLFLAKQLLNFTTGMKSLDIGAGLGKSMKAMEKAGFEAYGFEASRPFYERAISKMGIAPDRLKLGMIEDVDYAENMFDFISFSVVLEHFYHPAASIEKALRWLKTGGVIHIEVPNADYLIAKGLNRYFSIIGTNYVNNISPMHIPYHLYEFDIRSFEYLGRNLNYKIVHHEYYVGPIPVSGLLSKLLASYMKRTKTGMLLMLIIQK